MTRRYRYLMIASECLGAAVAALLAVVLMYMPAWHAFDRLLPGKRFEDMNLIGLLPYLAVLPIAVLATTLVHRRRWPLYMAPILSAAASAIFTFANGYLLVRSLTL